MRWLWWGLRGQGGEGTLRLCFLGNWMADGIGCFFLGRLSLGM